MPEFGEWFSPRTRPEMLSSDDPPIEVPKPQLVRILPGSGTRLGRLFAPVTRVLALIPELGRWIVRIERPTRWQLAGMWAAGSAIVVGTGLAVGAVVGGAPSGLSHQFDQLITLPGETDEASPETPDPAPDGGLAVPDGDHQASRGTGAGSGTSSGSSSSYQGYSGFPGVPAGAGLPAGFGVADIGTTSAPGTTSAAPVQPATSQPAPTTGSGPVSTAPAPSPSPSPPPVATTDTSTPTAEPPTTTAPAPDPTVTSPPPTDAQQTTTPPAEATVATSASPTANATESVAPASTSEPTADPSPSP